MDPVYVAIADETRRAILRDLAACGELSVGDLVARRGLPQPTVSKHLRTLREAKLVRVRSDHRLRYYALEAEPLQPVLDWVRYFETFWTTKLDALGAHLRKQRR